MAGINPALRELCGCLCDLASENGVGFTLDGKYDYEVAKWGIKSIILSLIKIFEF